MQARPKITREMLVDAAFALVREEGHGALSVRRIAARLHCSTQPVLYQFPSVEALRRAAYEAADSFHTAYLLDFDEDEDPMATLGRRYVRFAIEERNLFRFLFQSDEFAGRTLDELIAAPEVAPLLRLLGESAHIDAEQAAVLFRALFAAVHGFASLLANNAMRPDPEGIAASLGEIYLGMLTRMGGKQDEPTVQEE